MPKKRFLVVSDSYPPFINSASVLVEEFSMNLLRKDYDVTVLTTKLEQKNASDFKDPDIENFHVKRVKTYFQKSNIYVLRGIFSIFASVNLIIGVLFDKKYDYVFIYSPPLLYGFVGILLKFFKGSKIALNVQDLFPQNAIDLGILKNKYAIKFFKLVERFFYDTFDLVTFHSGGNLKQAQDSHGDKKRNKYVMHNWINFNEEIKNNGKTSQYVIGKSTIVYAGVVGPSQIDGLISFLVSFSELDSQKFHLLIHGEGTALDRLKKKVEDLSLHNVEIKDFIPEAEYMDLLKKVDIGLVALSKNVKTPVVPGKILGYMKNSLPVFAVANIDNDVHEIIKEAKNGVSSDHNISNKLKLFSNMDFKEMGNNGYIYAKKHYDINKIIGKFLDVFL